MKVRYIVQKKDIPIFVKQFKLKNEPIIYYRDDIDVYQFSFEDDIITGFCKKCEEGIICSFLNKNRCDSSYINIPKSINFIHRTVKLNRILN